MGNRFSTLTQYHKIILAHGILGAIVFLLLAPGAIMILRFYTGRPGYALRYHARIQIVGVILLTAAFILGNIAVGPARSLTNPHHGIGVALYVLYLVQFFLSRFIFRIQKARSLRVTLHQWVGRGTALLGIAQVPLGLTLYGSRKFLFILYAIWVAFLVVVYFILDFRAGTRRELLLSGGGGHHHSHVGHGESEYISEVTPRREEHSSKWKWLGPLAAGGAAWMFMRGGRKDNDKSSYRSRSQSPSYRSHSDRRTSTGYYESDKYTELEPPRKDKHEGGGMLKMLGGAAALFGAGKLVSNYMDKRKRGRDDEEYSAVSTETPRRHRSGRSAITRSGITSDYDSELSGDPTRTSLLSQSVPPSAMAGAISASTPRPKTSRPPPARYNRGRRNSFEDSEYSSYVSPSRRPVDDYDDESHHHHTATKAAGGLLGGVGLGWLGKKWADRRAKKEEDRRLQEEEDMRSGLSGSRFTGDGYPSPTRRPARRPTVRQSRPAPSAMTEMTESSYLDNETAGPSYVGPPPTGPVPLPGSGRRDRSHSRRRIEPPVSMPAMPPDPDLHSDLGSSYVTGPPPQRRESSRRRRAGERATAAAAARASELASEQEREREQFGSPHSQPLSVKLKMHDDRDRNVTLRRLTDEEARAAARGGSRGRSRADSEGSMSGIDSPSYGRSRYRRQQSSQRRSHSRADSASRMGGGSRPASRPPSSRHSRRRDDDESASELEGEGDQSTIGPLSPPNPAFAKPARRAGKDSAYYSGAPPAAAGPSGAGPSVPPGASGPNPTVSSLDSATNPESHGTWSQMTPSPAPGGGESAMDERRRKRRAERRRGSSSRPTTATDMFD